jgi:hypothetical protein
MRLGMDPVPCIVWGRTKALHRPPLPLNNSPRGPILTLTKIFPSPPPPGQWKGRSDAVLIRSSEHFPFPRRQGLVNLSREPPNFLARVLSFLVIKNTF